MPVRLAAYFPAPVQSNHEHANLGHTQAADSAIAPGVRTHVGGNAVVPNTAALSTVTPGAITSGTITPSGNTPQLSAAPAGHVGPAARIISAGHVGPAERVISAGNATPRARSHRPGVRAIACERAHAFASPQAGFRRAPVCSDCRPSHHISPTSGSAAPRVPIPVSRPRFIKGFPGFAPGFARRTA